MRSQNAGNAISESQILKISWGACPARPPLLSRACGTRLTPSAIAYYPGGGQGKWALWQFCPTTEESLKKCTVEILRDFTTDVLLSLQVNYSVGYGMSRIISYFSSGHKDRAWAFYCRRDSKVTSVCHWSGWLNWYNGELLYQCPTGVLAGNVYKIIVHNKVLQLFYLLFH